MATEGLQKSAKRIIWLLSAVIVLVAVAFALSKVLFLRQRALEYGRETHCASNQRQIALAILLYTEEHEGMYPRSFADLQLPAAVLHCQTDRKPFEYGDIQRISYGLNGHLGEVKSTQVHDPATLLLTADGGNARHLLQSSRDIAAQRHYYDLGAKMFCATYADGHVEFSEWTRAASLCLSPAMAPSPTGK